MSDFFIFITPVFLAIKTKVFNYNNHLSLIDFVFLFFKLLSPRTVNVITTIYAH